MSSIDRPVRASAFSVDGHRADAHDLGLDADEAVADQPHADVQPELLGDVLGGEQAGGRAVVEARGVAGGDVPVRAERRLQRAEPLEGGLRARRLVDGRDAPALLGRAGGHRYQLRADLAVGDGLGVLLLAGQRERVGALLGQVREPVVQVLGGGAHDQGGLVDQLLAEEPRVGVGALTHRVAAHVLDAAGDGDVVGAEGDAAGGGGHRGHGAGAHAVDRVAGHRLRQPGEQRGGPAQGQALVADLRGGGDGHLVDALGGQRRVAAHQLADAADDEVVGARLGVDALRAGLAERGAHAVDEDDLTQRAWPPFFHGHRTSAGVGAASDGARHPPSYPPVTGRPSRRTSPGRSLRDRARRGTSVGLESGRCRPMNDRWRMRSSGRRPGRAVPAGPRSPRSSRRSG